MREKIIRAIQDSILVKGDVLKTQAAIIEKAAAAIVNAISSGGKLLVCGNGGSAADSQHIVAELVGRFKKERKPMAAVALTTNTSIITAIANDYGYDVVFERQVIALGGPKDVLLGISTSGNSKSVNRAVQAARSIGMKTIGLTGGSGGELGKIVDIPIVVPSKDTPRIQESHLMIGHILCELVEDEVCKV